MKRVAGWMAAALVVLTSVLVIYRRELADWLKPDFRVTTINSSEGTMTLERANHRYTVRCSDTCSAFHKGGHYPMEYRGDALEYRQRKYLILEIDIIFPATPGGLG